MTQLYQSIRPAPGVQLPGVQLPGVLQRPQVLRPTAPGIAPNTIGNPPPAELGRGGISPLPHLLPEASVYQAGIRKVAVPAGGTYTANTAAWFKFFTLDANAEAELGLNSIQMQLGPCDVDGAGIPGDDDTTAANFLAYGTNLGTGAAIVVGINLPGQRGVWAEGPANILGLYDGAASPPTPSRQVANVSSVYLAVQTFAPGKLSDAVPWVQNVTRAFGLAIGRIGAGRTLDISLVVNPTKVDDTACASQFRYLACFANVAIHSLALDSTRSTVS